MNYLKKILIEVCQGFAIGIANVIPGFSGGTMAVIFHIYERLINALSEILFHPIKVIKDIWAIILGLVMGIIFAIIAITNLLKIAPVPTILFFVGLIIGSIPYIATLAKDNGKVKFQHFLSLIIAITILVILPLIGHKQVEVENLTFKLVVTIFLLGIIVSATMVIPGVSGSLVLLVLGYYFLVTESISKFINGLLNFEFNSIVSEFIVLLFFGLGAILGIVYISKLIRFLFKKSPKLVYFIILGLLLASPYSIIMAMLNEYPNAFNDVEIYEYIVSAISLLLGGFIAMYSSTYERKKEDKKVEC